MLPPDPGDDRLSREDRGDLLRRYGRAVVDGAAGRPLLVFVDDAHLLDDGSATLLHQLALTRAATVLATVRSGERAPDPVVSLWKDALADRIEVSVLVPRRLRSCWSRCWCEFENLGANLAAEARAEAAVLLRRAG
jgi:hypothetical protein